MNIGAAASASGVSAKMIRYYEEIGLMTPTTRRANGYRDYGSREIHELRFIGRARALGFSMDEIAALTSLWRDRRRPSREVRSIAAAHLSALETRAAEIQSMIRALQRLVHACHGDERPECPILDELSAWSNDPVSSAAAMR
jgi:MerR family transcriptional regulator, copper efflux regulator